MMHHTTDIYRHTESPSENEGASGKDFSKTQKSSKKQVCTKVAVELSQSANSC